MGKKGKNGVTLKQRRAIKSLMDGQSVEEAAITAGVSRRSLYRWLHDERFLAELRKAQKSATTGHVAALAGELEKSRRVLTSARDDKTASWHVRMRAAQLLEESFARWINVAEFEDRLAKLEERASESD